MAEKSKNWIVYILGCGDGSFYTGITNNLEARIKAHRSGKGAKYTKGRLPLTLIYKEDCVDRSTASKREIAIKRLSKVEKIELVKSA
ncbi:MAG: GIY-YIG nuclease family protein [Pseudomonadota bacterium]